jgi:hypothetical protein
MPTSARAKLVVNGTNGHMMVAVVHGSNGHMMVVVVNGSNGHMMVVVVNGSKRRKGQAVVSNCTVLLALIVHLTPSRHLQPTHPFPPDPWSSHSSTALVMSAPGGRDPSAESGRDPSAESGRDPSAESGRDPSAESGRDPSAESGRVSSQYLYRSGCGVV